MIFKKKLTKTLKKICVKFHYLLNIKGNIETSTDYCNYEMFIPNILIFRDKFQVARLDLIITRRLNIYI